MKICSNAVQHRDALEEIKPSKIAVAFVGEGWKKYVSPKHLKEIVLSPTLGSNPKAIEQIMDMIGESNVYFLDNLHSKIYLGKKSALLGSSNLSDNGLADSRLWEAGIVLSDHPNLERLRSVFDTYKNRALRLYPTKESKKEKLHELIKQWQSSIWHGLNTDHSSGKSPAITNYTSDQDQIHIAWYQLDNNIVYNKKAIDAVVPDASGISPDDYFTDAFMFHEKDSIKQGDWILCWHCRNDGYPRKNCEIYWFHVHHVVPNGYYDDNYTKLVGQARNLQCPTPPFDLDPRTQRLIRDALTSKKFPALLSLDDAAWQLTPADKVVPEFLEYLRKKAKQGAPSDSTRIHKRRKAHG